jgi:hypothetical protein
MGEIIIHSTTKNISYSETVKLLLLEPVKARLVYYL